MTKETVIAVGQQFEVEALRLNDDGEGVVSIHGFTVFVPSLLPGEKALVQIKSSGRSFGRADVIRRFSQSPARVDAPCPVFEHCGGCQLQHLPYEAQLDHKQQTVQNALRRVGKFDTIQVHPTLGMEWPWRYRNNVQVPIRFDEDGNFEVGFYAPGSHTLVSTEVCLLEPELMEQTVQAVAHTLSKHIPTGARQVHHMVLRQSFSTKELMVVLVAGKETGDLNFKIRANHGTATGRGATVVDYLLALPGVVSVALTIQPDLGAGTVWGEDVLVLGGKSVLTERLGHVEYLVSPRSFFQVNPIQTLTLYEEVRKCIAAGKEDVMLDAYSGTGTIALWLSSQVKSVTGIESIPDAVQDARRNAEHNHITNARFLVGKVEAKLQDLAAAKEHFDVVVVDPPRKGCSDVVLKALIDLAPRQIVYVSCNPSTLARDLRRLADAGYGIGPVQPVDMFPQTSHVECVVSTYRVD